MEIVDKYYHSNGSAVPFIAALVDDPADGDTKIVIMFDERDFTAVFSLDSLLRDEDISARNNGYHGDKYEKLREDLWDGFLE